MYVTNILFLFLECLIPVWPWTGIFPLQCFLSVSKINKSEHSSTFLVYYS